LTRTKLTASIDPDAQELQRREVAACSIGRLAGEKRALAEQNEAKLVQSYDRNKMSANTTPSVPTAGLEWMPTKGMQPAIDNAHRQGLPDDPRGQLSAINNSIAGRSVSSEDGEVIEDLMTCNKRETRGQAKVSPPAATRGCISTVD
jgi:hypothetical protein